MKVVLKKHKEAIHFEGENELGSKISIDAYKSIGGLGEGIRPMELVLMAIAGCSSIDICLILQKQKQIVESFEIEVNGVRKDAVPAVFESTHLTFTLSGELDEKKVKRAIELSLEKYCSVSKMIDDKVDITYDLKLI